MLGGSKAENLGAPEPAPTEAPEPKWQLVQRARRNRAKDDRSIVAWGIPPSTSIVSLAKIFRGAVSEDHPAPTMTWEGVHSEGSQRVMLAFDSIQARDERLEAFRSICRSRGWNAVPARDYVT